MREDITEKLTRLEDLPALSPDYVRLVHRLVYGNGRSFESIKQNGLVFNREAAHLAPDQIGGSYNGPSNMVSVYDEALFWASMKHDDFACYDNARYADVKMIFDVPKDEFVFLQKFGRRVHGRIDSKYLVGCVPNYNGANKDLSLNAAQIEKAHYLSQHNPPIQVEENNLEEMMSSWPEKIRTSGKLKQKLAIARTDLEAAFQEKHEEEHKAPALPSSLVIHQAQTQHR
jgi:hypothetical protein